MKFRIAMVVLTIALGLVACGDGEVYAPKPKGYFRIYYPEKEYRHFTDAAPFTFEYPVYGGISPDISREGQQYWYNLSFPQFNARLHLTYYPIKSISEYNDLVEDARRLAFKHTIKANAIDQRVLSYPEHKVYGLYYEIVGNTASSAQFFLTDSTKNYFRGALYFNERPQYDSIAPVVDFIRKDIDKLIGTFRWRNR